MAARLAPDNVRRMHQSLHHFVADAPWDDEVLLDRALDTVLTSMLQREPVVAWVVDDTGFPKKGRHSVGVIRQYCGQVGKQDNCRVAVSLSVTTEKASMPIAFRLYLPEAWANDEQRREKAGVPAEIKFQTKPQIALAGIERARERGIPEGVVLADAGYGNDTQFRERLSEWKLSYVAGIQSGVTVWKPGEQPLPALEEKGTGRPPKLLRRDPKTSAGDCEGTCANAALRRMEDGCLETGSEEETRLTLRRRSRAMRSPGLLARRAACGRMAADRMARGRR
jgi:SRSO17 transposase